MPLDDDVKAFATTSNLAALTTLFEDGHPQTQIMWVDADDDHLLINTQVDRQKYRNVLDDPRVAVTIWDADDPYRYVEVRGRVVGEFRGEDAMRQNDVMSQRYRGEPFDHSGITAERVVLRIAPDRVVRRRV